MHDGRMEDKMDDGMLSQDEINALLMSMDLSGNADSTPISEPEPESEPE